MNYGNSDNLDAYIDKEGFPYGHEDFKVPMATETERDESSMSSESGDDSLKPQERETWTRKIDFLLACIGFSVGLGNVWRFPYLCYKNGGGAFLLPYLVCAAVGGVPVFFLEVAVGQFMSSGGMASWKLCPLLQGIGLATTVIVFLLNIYYNVILGWAIYYLFNSFTSVLPWSHCNNDWNTDNCVRDIHLLKDTVAMGNGSALLGNDSDITSYAEVPYAVARGNSSALALLMKNHTDPITEFWERKVLQLSDGIEDVGNIRWELALCLLLAWVIVYFCIWKGIKTSGKVMYFTATAPYVLMTVLLIRGVTLPGALEGVKFYILPDWEKLTDIQVWVGAGTQIFFSYSISIGTLTALGSYNKFHHNSYKDSILFAMCNSMTSFFAGFAIFSVLGFMAHQQGVGVGEVAESGPGLAFIAYPKAVAEMPVAPLWSILFFCMILLLGLDSQFVGVEGFVTSVQDMFPDFLRKGRRREIFIALVCVVSFFIGLCMVTNGGIYIFMLFDYYSGSRVILLVAFFECIVVAWFYGVRRFYDNLEMMYGFRINPYMKICWAVITPLFTLTIFSLCIYSYSDLTYNRTYHYPRWALNIGWLMAATSVIMIPVFMVIQIVQTPGSLAQRLKTLMRPKLKPHQLRPQDTAADLDCDQIYTVTGPNTESMLPELNPEKETCLSNGNSPIYKGSKPVPM